MSEYLIKLTNRDNSIIKQEHEETEQTGDNAKTDYRYIGANPNNYICLESDGNCDESELYRIIGVIPTQKEDKGEYENRVKLVKYTSYGRYSWSGSLSNKSSDWTQSTLNKEILNETYWSEIEDYQKYIELAKWYLNGGSSCSLIVNEYYRSERSGTANTVTNVGLIYVSDFGYATSGNESKKRDECFTQMTSRWIDEYLACNQTNYLYDTIETGKTKWTIDKVSNTTACVIEKETYTSSGVHLGGTNTWLTSDMTLIYPSFYLKSTVKYSSGTGTKDNPYQVIID